MEIKWTEPQRKKWKQKIIDHFNKKHHATDYANEILRKCKELNGPVITITELNVLMKNAQKKKMS